MKDGKQKSLFLSSFLLRDWHCIDKSKAARQGEPTEVSIPIHERWINIENVNCMIKSMYLDKGVKITMLPNSVLAIIVLCDESKSEPGPAQPLNKSSAGSLYEKDPYM